MHSTNSFLSDGYERHVVEIEAAIRSAVVAEYTARYAKASWLGRLGMTISIWREIQCRIQKDVSTRCLY
jgi:hypothetical protein